MFQKLTSMEFGISIQLIVIVCIIFSLVTASDLEKGSDLSICVLIPTYILWQEAKYAISHVRPRSLISKVHTRIIFLTERANDATKPY